MTAGTGGGLDILGTVRWALLLVGLAALGYSGYVYANAEIYQKYQNWAFDEELHGRKPSVKSFLEDSTPLRRVLRRRVFLEEQQESAATADSLGRVESNPGEAHSHHSSTRELVERALIGRIEIPRLRMSAMVREGDDEDTLRRAVGHLPDTPRPGQKGNVTLAGHRDTFFRALRNAHKNDRISIRTLDGDYHYVIESTRIVDPEDLDVLKASSGNTLTLVTCYPFWYVGHAPRRFVVRARQLENRNISRRTAKGAAEAAAAAVVSTPSPPDSSALPLK